MFRFHPRRRPPLPATSSLSLRWRVMLLAMSMVAMVVVLMAFAVYAVISAALYDDIDNQLQSRGCLDKVCGKVAGRAESECAGACFVASSKGNQIECIAGADAP